MNERQKDRRQVLSAIAAVAASRALGFPLALAVNIWLARTLEREDFAFFGVLTTFSLLFALFAQAGFQTGVVRMLGEAEAGFERFGKAAIFYSSLLVTFAVGGLLGCAFFFAGPAILPDISAATPWLFLLAAVLLVARSTNTVTAQALRGIGKVGASANLSGQGDQGGLIRCIMMIAGISLVSLDGTLDLEAALVVSIAASLLCTLWASVLVLRHTGLTSSMSGIVRTVSDGRHDNFNMLISEALLYWSWSTAAVVIGGVLIDASAMAGVVAAFQVSYILTSPITMIAGSVPRILIRLQKAGEQEELEAVLRGTASAAFLFCLVACAFLLAIGPAGFQAVFGPSYSDAYYHIAILSVGILFFVYCGLSGQALLLMGDTRVHRQVMLRTVLVTTPAYVLLALYFGPYGLSIGLALSMILQKILLIRAVKQDLGLNTQAYLDPREYLKLVRFLKRLIAQRG